MMTYDEKALLPYSDDGMHIEPMTVLEIKCHRCGEHWRVPVRRTFTDWKMVADEYEKRHKFVVSRVTEYIKELEVEIGPLPSTLRTKALLMQLRDMVARMHEQDTRKRNALRKRFPKHFETKPEMHDGDEIIL